MSMIKNAIMIWRDMKEAEVKQQESAKHTFTRKCSDPTENALCTVRILNYENRSCASAIKVNKKHGYPINMVYIADSKVAAEAETV